MPNGVPTTSPYQDFTLTDTDASGNPYSVLFKILNITSPKDSIGSSNKRRTIQYQISFSDFGKAQKLLIGWPEFATFNDGSAHLKRHTPHSYTDPNGALLYCTSIPDAVGMQPKAVTNSTDDPYQFMFLTCLYEALPYLVVDDNTLESPTGIEIVAGKKGLLRYIELGDVASTGSIYKQMIGGFAFAHIYGTKPGDADQSASFPEDRIPDGAIDFLIDRPQRAVAQGIPFGYREQVIELIWHHVPRDNAPLDLAFAMQNTINDADFYIWSSRSSDSCRSKPDSCVTFCESIEIAAQLARAGSGRLRSSFLRRPNRDSVQPTRSQVPRSDRSGSTGQHEKRRLEGVFRVVMIAQNSTTHGENHRSVTLYDRLEGSFISPETEHLQKLAFRNLQPRLQEGSADFSNDPIHRTRCSGAVSARCHCL
jgi:hypothetical protein